MKRKLFLQTLVSSLALLPTLSWSKGSSREVKTKPIEPLDALDAIMHQLAEEFGTEVKSCTGEGRSHTRTVKTFKLPKQFGDKDRWVCLKIQTTHHSGFIDAHEKDHFTRATMFIKNHNPISEYTEKSLSLLIASGDMDCGDGGFGIDVNVRTCTLKDSGKTKLLSTGVDVRRRVYNDETIHPLHRRIIPLFEELT